MTDVTKNESESRYEAREDGVLAGFLDYTVTDGVVDLHHTEVDEAFGGRGIAGELVKGVLDGVRAEGLKATASCPYAATWIARHPEYHDLRV